jgi:hypothetical protein
LSLLILAHIVQWKPSYLPLTALAVGALAASYVSYGGRAWKYRREIVGGTANPGS